MSKCHLRFNFHSKRIVDIRKVEERIMKRRWFSFLCPQTSCLCCSWPCGCWEGWATWPLPTTHWVGPSSWLHSTGSPPGNACWELWGSWPPQSQLLFWGRTGDVVDFNVNANVLHASSIPCEFWMFRYKENKMKYNKIKTFYLSEQIN